MTAVLLYLPVLHAGYEAFLARHPGAEVLVLGETVIAEYPVLAKEIRALRPARAAALVGGRVVEKGDLAGLAGPLVAPDEEIMRDLADRYALADRTTFEPTFLRWDRFWSRPGRPADFTGTVDTSELARRLLGQAATEAERSSDWWRQVGALAARDGQVLDRAHNTHQPTEYAPYLDGDPRNDFHRGERADLSTALHAEAAIIARAARDGRPLAGADLYVTTFPCPACARLVATAGFTRCHFAGPYAVLDGDRVLRAAGVELVWVDLG